MGLSIFGYDVGDAFDRSLQDVKSTIVPTVIAGAEQWGAQQLASMSKAQQQVAQQGVTQIMNAPAATSGIVLSIQNMLKGVTTNAAVQKYGGWVMAGVAGVIVVGYIMGRK